MEKHSSTLEVLCPLCRMKGMSAIFYVNIQRNAISSLIFRNDFSGSAEKGYKGNLKNSNPR